jgi:hypothetical protein
MHFHLLLLVVLLSSTTTVMTRTYQWVDQNGIVSYSQIPPPSLQAETVDIKPTAPASTSDGKDGLHRLRQRLEDDREDRKLAQETARKARQAAEIKQQTCAAARSNLQKLLNLGNRMLKTSDGNYLRLSENERQIRIQTTRSQIEAHCTR